jgi:hypothetical protein
VRRQRFGFKSVVQRIAGWEGSRPRLGGNNPLFAWFAAGQGNSWQQRVECLLKRTEAKRRAERPQRVVSFPASACQRGPFRPRPALGAAKPERRAGRLAPKPFRTCGIIFISKQSTKYNRLEKVFFCRSVLCFTAKPGRPLTVGTTLFFDHYRRLKTLIIDAFAN